ncbi:efflux RND transporter periplasmic adaptor subunit [Lentisphaera marina]|uniref:efflux RND transporter periplasmic adaptor subunit n=1 Tax=Lentisphaera marina TaxID=1111041 RepID=UPI002365A420|nr:efflux RND transporter periplasmic adaptor subunit [Lentisphaera marina]MDD7984461.1 efflux RND transporter periplasmic adaptor subunit [Lentisphaera marina]
METKHRTKIVILLGLLLLISSCKEKQVAREAPVPQVVYEEALMMSVQPTTELVGRVRSFSSVDLRARVEGILEQRHFQTGTLVNKNDLLYTIEKDQYEINYKRAQAELDSAKARLTLAQSIFERMKTLDEKKAIAKQDFDKAIGDRDESEAAYNLAQAKRDEAKLHLEWCEIRSPITGIPGARKYDTGNLISPSSGVLVNVTSTEKMEVDFDIPERQLVDFQRKFVTKELRQTITDRIQCKLSLPDGTRYEHEGKIAFFDNRINKSTGTVKATTHFDNPEGLLRDGMFVKVLLTYIPPTAEERGENEEVQKPKIVVQQSAVMQDQAGHYVIVVNKESKAEIKRVKFKESFEEYFVIESGLEEGDKVITLGLQTVIPGRQVKGIPAKVEVDETDHIKDSPEKSKE